MSTSLSRSISSIERWFLRPKATGFRCRVLALFWQKAVSRHLFALRAKVFERRPFLKFFKKNFKIAEPRAISRFARKKVKNFKKVSPEGRCNGQKVNPSASCDYICSENMEGRFVWLGGWPQGLGPAGSGAEFLNL